MVFVPGQAGWPNPNGKGVCQSSSNEILVAGPHQSEKKLSPWVKELRLYLEYLWCKFFHLRMCAQSLGHVWLLCNPLDCSQPGFSVRGIFQARILGWVAISSSRGSSPSRDASSVAPTLTSGIFFFFWPLSHLGNPELRISMTKIVTMLMLFTTISLTWNSREILFTLNSNMASTKNLRFVSLTPSD